jgi:hypothetical protein
MKTKNKTYTVYKKIKEKKVPSLLEGRYVFFAN